jgi:hypothetical protein
MRPLRMHCTQTFMDLFSPFGRQALIVCRFGMKRRLVIPVTLVPTPPKYLALPRISTEFPTCGPLPHTSQTLDIIHLAIISLVRKFTFVANFPRSFLNTGPRSITMGRGKATSKNRLGIFHFRRFHRRFQRATSCRVKGAEQTSVSAQFNNGVRTRSRCHKTSEGTRFR